MTLLQRIQFVIKSERIFVDYHASFLQKLIIYIGKMAKRTSKCARKEYLHGPFFTGRLISVEEKIIFTMAENESFQGLIKLVNKSSEYVAFVVRSSNSRQFKIRPRYGYLDPKSYLEVIVATKQVKQFHEISKESFGVFAVAIFDKRQLDLSSISLLWKAYGTDMFPFEAVEFHKITCLLPKYDSYNDNLSILGRLSQMNWLSRMKYNSRVLNEDCFRKTVDKETFESNWPSATSIQVDDPNLELILSEWHSLAKKIDKQTKSIIHSTRHIIAMMVAGAGSFLMTSYYLWQATPSICCDKAVEETVKSTETSSGWFSWFS